ncbi:MAG: ABC transporter ATP-binding protein [Candidatus Rokubacteria bacterium]|nr:ABC transporter ATP-binding protein [Candidatus Rokubacteria bacterium]
MFDRRDRADGSPTKLAGDLLMVSDLRVSFATDQGLARVLDGVSLTVGHGEVLGLVGESGCGKTTLARAILGVLPANAARIDSGSIVFRGEPLLDMPPEEIAAAIRGRRITFIPQDPLAAFNPLFRVGSQIDELMKWKSPRCGPERRSGISALLVGYSRARRTADRADVAELLRRIQIPEPGASLSKLPHEFSGGQRQRLMIAMSLLPDPELIVADEPTTALDVTIQAQILRLLRALVKERGISVLFTTHNMGTAHEICDRVTVMYAGQEMETAPTRSFFARPAHPYTAKLLESLPRPGREIREIGGEIPGLIDPPAGCRFHPRCTYTTDVCRHERPAPRQVGDAHAVRCHHPLAPTETIPPGVPRASTADRSHAQLPGQLFSADSR